MRQCLIPRGVSQSINHFKTHEIPDVPEPIEVATGLHFLNTGQGLVPLTHELSTSLDLRGKPKRGGKGVKREKGEGNKRREGLSQGARILKVE